MIDDRPEWQRLYEDPQLRQYFVDLSKGMSRCQELQEDLFIEAWIRIGEYLQNYPGGKRHKFYQDLGKRAMRACYMRVWRDWKKRGDYYPNKEALRKRIERAEKKYQNHVQELMISRE